MEKQSVDKLHIRHLMLYEFRKHNNATNATNATNAINAILVPWIAEHVMV